MDFDPYSEWLKIPAGPRPPCHHVLLGLACDESDADRIHEAFQSQYEEVRRYHLGSQAAVASRLLGELSTAYNCLSDAGRRADYWRRQAADAVDRWLAAPTAPEDIYQLLGSRLFVPDRAYLTAALEGARQRLAAVPADGPQHTRHRELADELAAVERALLVATFYRDYHRAIVRRLGERYEQAQGQNRSQWNKDRLAAWLRDVAQVHPARADSLAEAMCVPNDDAAARRLAGLLPAAATNDRPTDSILSAELATDGPRSPANKPSARPAPPGRRVAAAARRSPARPGAAVAELPLAPADEEAEASEPLRHSWRTMRPKSLAIALPTMAAFVVLSVFIVVKVSGRRPAEPPREDPWQRLHAMAGAAAPDNEALLLALDDFTAFDHESTAWTPQQAEACAMRAAALARLERDDEVGVWFARGCIGLRRMSEDLAARDAVAAWLDETLSALRRSGDPASFVLAVQLEQQKNDALAAAATVSPPVTGFAPAVNPPFAPDRPPDNAVGQNSIRIGNLKRLVRYAGEVHLLVESNLAGAPAAQEFFTTAAGIDKQLTDFNSQEECGRAASVNILGTPCLPTAAKYRLDPAAPLAELREVSIAGPGFSGRVAVLGQPRTPPRDFLRPPLATLLQFRPDMGEPVAFSGFITKVNGPADWELAVENRSGLRTANVRLAVRDAQHAVGERLRVSGIVVESDQDKLLVVAEGCVSNPQPPDTLAVYLPDGQEVFASSGSPAPRPNAAGDDKPLNLFGKFLKTSLVASYLPRSGRQRISYFLLSSVTGSSRERVHFLPDSDVERFLASLRNDELLVCSVRLDSRFGTPLLVCESLARAESPSDRVDCANELPAPTAPLVGRAPAAPDLAGYLTSSYARPTPTPPQKSWQANAHVGEITAVSYGPSGGYVAVAGAEGGLNVIDARSGAAGTPIAAHTGRIHALTWISRGKTDALLASAGVDGVVRVWTVTAGQLQTKAAREIKLDVAILAMDYHETRNTSNSMVLGLASGGVFFCDPRPGVIRGGRRRALGGGPVNRVLWSPAPNLDLFVTADTGGTLWLIDANAPSALPLWGCAKSQTAGRQELLNSGAATRGQLDSGNLIINHTSSAAPYRGLALSGDGKALAFVQERFELFEYRSNYPAPALSLPRTQTFTTLAQNGLLWQPGNSNNLVGWSDNTVSVFHRQKGLQAALWQADAPVYAASFNVDGKLLAVGLKSGVVEVWHDLTISP